MTQQGVGGDVANIYALRRPSVAMTAVIAVPALCSQPMARSPFRAEWRVVLDAASGRGGCGEGAKSPSDGRGCAGGGGYGAKPVSAFDGGQTKHGPPAE